MPEQKIARDPWLKRMFLGYAFSIDYRDRRGHAFMLADQEATQRLTKPQTGSCLHCHAAVMPLYRELGNGDAATGSRKATSSPTRTSTRSCTIPATPIRSRVDCHDPKTMQLRVTRPRLHPGNSRSRPDAPPPSPVVSAGGRVTTRPYNPNADATWRVALLRCGQCHVEHYCSSQMPLTFPWGKGLRAGDVEKFWNETKFADGTRFLDYKHAETGAPILKAQHPEFELWSQGIHARSGVACADCHMPYQRDGATKVSDHWVRSPLLNINRACQTCHRAPAAEIKARVETIRPAISSCCGAAGAAITALIDAIVAAKKDGATDARLQPARSAQGAVARFHCGRELDTSMHRRRRRWCSARLSTTRGRASCRGAVEVAREGAALAAAPCRCRQGQQEVSAARSLSASIFQHLGGWFVSSLVSLQGGSG
jgi:nitrite reductase (cytochrome c-552)